MYVGYFTIKCAECKRVFRAYSVSPDYKPFKCCVFCGGQHISVEQDPECDVVELLAAHYNCSIAKVQKALSIWTEEVKEATQLHKQPISFHDFMVGDQ